MAELLRSLTKEIGFSTQKDTNFVLTHVQFTAIPK